MEDYFRQTRFACELRKTVKFERASLPSTDAICKLRGTRRQIDTANVPAIMRQTANKVAPYEASRACDPS
jgi:hypothetical protein